MECSYSWSAAVFSNIVSEEDLRSIAESDQYEVVKQVQVRMGLVWHVSDPVVSNTWTSCSDCCRSIMQTS